MKITKFCRAIDDTFDSLLASLDCSDGSDAYIISHWQGDEIGMRLQVTRKMDGVAVSRVVRPDGTVRL